MLTGRLEHEELAPLLAASEAQIVPSTFPEAFGMVAVEAAACGALPIVADHSGLGEVRAILAGAVPVGARAWLGFAIGTARGARPQRPRDRLAAGAGGAARGDARGRSRPSRASASRGTAWPAAWSSAALGETAALPEP